MTAYRVIFDELTGFAVEITNANGVTQTTAAFLTETEARDWITEQVRSGAVARSDRARKREQ